MAKPMQKKMDEPPYYTVLVRCPICQYSPIPFVLPKAKCRNVFFDRFMMAHYTSLAGYTEFDWSSYEITVCPNCYFASPEKTDFITKNWTGNGELPSQLSQIQKEKFALAKAHALSIVSDKAGDKKVFVIPRSEEVVQVAFDLAIFKSIIDDKIGLDLGKYRIASYYLKKASIRGLSSSQSEKWLQNSARIYEEFFTTKLMENPEIEFQTLYRLMALNLYLKKFEESFRYFEQFAEIREREIQRGQKEDESYIRCLDKWQEKAKYLWEDREREDLWSS